MTETTKNNIRTYEIIISVAAILLFGVLFAVTELFKNPFIVLGTILFILYPYIHIRLIRMFFALSIIITALWFLHNISNLLIPFIIAFIIAYVVDPIVFFLSKKSMKRWEASLLVVVSTVLIFVLVSIIVAPLVVVQFAEFIKELPVFFKGFQVWINSGLIPFLNSIGIPTDELQSNFANNLPNRMEDIFNTFVGGISGVFTGVTIILSSIANIILIPFLTFYISKDFENLKKYLKNLIPPKNRKRSVTVYHKIDDIIGNYIRGDILTSIYNGIGVGIGLYFIGVRYAFLLGLIAALLDLIPYFGFIVTIALTTIIALLSGGNILLKVVLTILLNVVVNIIENAYISPKIIGERIGLHPVLLILSLLMFDYFLGFLGLLIAIPAMAIILMFLNEWLESRDAAFKHIKAE